MSETTALVLSDLPALPVVTANFDELRRSLDSLLDDYRGTVIERKDYKQAKNYRAYLNGLIKDLTERNREVKRHYLAPHAIFNENVKELEAMIAAVSGPIDEQIKRIEAEMRTEKRAELVDHYECCIGIAAELVPYERIEDTRWLNQSVSLQSAKDEITAIVRKLVEDEATLSELGLPHEAKAKAELFATLDLGKAIAKSKAIEAEIEAKRAEAERLQRFEAEKAELNREPEPEPVPVVQPAPPTLDTWIFTVTSCSIEQRDQIAGFIGSLGLEGRMRRGQ